MKNFGKNWENVISKDLQKTQNFVGLTVYHLAFAICIIDSGVVKTLYHSPFIHNFLDKSKELRHSKTSFFRSAKNGQIDGRQ